MTPRLVLQIVPIFLAGLAWAVTCPMARSHDAPAAVAVPPAIAWQAEVAAGPSARYGATLVLDVKNDRLLLLAGETNVHDADGRLKRFDIHDDLWAFHLADRTWKRLAPVGDKPSRRVYHAACYDPKREGLWLFGGFDGKMRDDIWFFDCGQDTWKKIAVQGPSPAARDGHDLFYDAAGDRLMTFGGLADATTMACLDDLWTFDPQTAQWTRETPANAGPSGRFLCAAALDQEDREIHLQGGFGAGGRGTDGLLWTYEIATGRWRSIEPVWAEGGPKRPLPGLAAGRMAVAGPTRLVCYGGRGSDIEAWFDRDRQTWLPPAHAKPPARSYHALAADVAGGKVYVFGGTEGGFTAPCVPADLWVGTLPGDK